jgi:hypothetical protein
MVASCGGNLSVLRTARKATPDRSDQPSRTLGLCDPRWKIPLAETGALAERVVVREEIERERKNGRPLRRPRLVRAHTPEIQLPVPKVCGRRNWAF